MKKNHTKFYEQARCYDIAFDFRDVPAECDFIAAVARRHLEREPSSFLELAAGPAQHAREFAGRGWRSTALDNGRPMLDYAAACARKQGVPLDTLCADMTDFQSSVRFDCAALLMDSASYLLDNAAVMQHLECVADHLNHGGIYLLEMSHPRDVFRVGRSQTTEWDMERDGTTVRVEWGSDDDVFDPITQVTPVKVTLRTQGPEGDNTLVDHASQRCFTRNEFQALVTASGRFELKEFFGSMKESVPFTNAKEAWRMVPVLQKAR